MTICDVCSSEAEGVAVPVREFQRHVAAGRFDPIRLRLVEGHPGKGDAGNFAFWSAVVSQNETDWFLCHHCHAVYLGCTAEPAPSAAKSEGGAMNRLISGLPHSLDEIRRRQPQSAPPQIPADWRPGFLSGLFGRGKPWGGTGEAVSLIRHGRIAEGRELLLRIVAHSSEVSARLVLCLESRRQPEFAGFNPSTIIASLPAAERAGVDAMFAFTKLDYTWLEKAFMEATERVPTSELAAFFLMMALVGAGDLWLQTQILFPRKGQIEGAINAASSKGLALLLERRHGEAWEVFRACIADPDKSIAGYGRTLRVELSAEENGKLAGALRDFCVIGCGLVLFDLGCDAERRAHFRTLAPTFTGSAARACELLG